MSDDKKPTRMRHPTSRAEVGCRLSAVLDAIGTRRRASEIAGRSTDQLAKYEKGLVEPPFTPLARLCIASDVRMEWLATGEGPMLASEVAPDKASQPARPDHGTLRAAAEVLERALADVDVTTDAAGRAELLVAIYELLEQGSALDAAQRVVATMLRAASRATGAISKQG